MQTFKHFRLTGSRRKAKRVPLKIVFEIVSHDENGIHFSTWGHTRDISREGGCILLDRCLLEGEILKLKSPKGIPFIARVCWSNYDHKLNLQHVGFKLTSNRGWVMHEIPSEGSSIYFNQID
jgi:hypothetical protein